MPFLTHVHSNKHPFWFNLANGSMLLILYDLVLGLPWLTQLPSGGGWKQHTWQQQMDVNQMCFSSCCCSEAPCFLFQSFSAAISAKIISCGLASSLGDAWARHGCHDLSADLQRQGVEGCGWQAALPCHHWKLLGFPRSKSTLHDNHPLFCWATFSVVIRHTRRTMRRILAKESHDRFTLQPFAPLAQILQKIKCRNS